jgi:hypothetical protein
MYYVRETEVLAAAADEWASVHIHGAGGFGAIPYKTPEEALRGLNEQVGCRISDWVGRDLYYEEREDESKEFQRAFFHKDQFGMNYHVTFDIIKIEKID